MIALVWFALVMTTQGHAVVPIQETTTFKTNAECQAFGEKMKDRTADYVRGLGRLDWDAPVEIAFKCGPTGQAI